MTRKKTWIMVATLVNLLFVPFAFGSNPGASGQGSNILYDCCQDSERGGRYCCDRCCWLPWGCGITGDCSDD